MEAPTLLGRLALLLLLPLFALAQLRSSKSQCVPITMNLCMDLAYNQTIYPNLLGHANQDEAANQLNQFSSLITVKCSKDIKMFLCTVYAPVCTVLNRPIEPCRHLCLSAKSGCVGLMEKFGFHWPDSLDCDKFPTEGICVGENTTATSAPAPAPPAHRASLECPIVMRTQLRPHFQLELPNATLTGCSLQCSADDVVPVFLGKSTRLYLRLWTGGWAVACFVCSLFTIVTFLVELSRFEYPVRPILYMSVCFLAISFVYMLGVVGEDRFACGAFSNTHSKLVTQGIESVSCSALAVSLLFFSFAASLWWFVLCLAWFLAATFKWGQESIDALYAQFHVLCWGGPAVLAVAVLLTESIDGDVFTGVCSVGNLRPNALIYFNCSVSGLILLFFGIVSMLRIRRYMKLKSHDVDANLGKLEKLMLRILAYSIMFILPTALSLAITCYQAQQMPRWLEQWYAQRCQRVDRNLFFSQPRSQCPRVHERDIYPEYLIFFSKYVAQLVVGITGAVWVFSSKTLSSFSRAYYRLAHRRHLGDN